MFNNNTSVFFIQHLALSFQSEGTRTNVFMNLLKKLTYVHYLMVQTRWRAYNCLFDHLTRKVTLYNYEKWYAHTMLQKASTGNVTLWYAVY